MDVVHATKMVTTGIAAPFATVWSIAIVHLCHPFDFIQAEVSSYLFFLFFKLLRNMQAVMAMKQALHLILELTQLLSSTALL